MVSSSSAVCFSIYSTPVIVHPYSCFVLRIIFLNTNNGLLFQGFCIRACCLFRWFTESLCWSIKSVQMLRVLSVRRISFSYFCVASTLFLSTQWLMFTKYGDTVLLNASYWLVRRFLYIFYNSSWDSSAHSTCHCLYSNNLHREFYGEHFT